MASSGVKAHAKRVFYYGRSKNANGVRNAIARKLACKIGLLHRHMLNSF